MSATPFLIVSMLFFVITGVGGWFHEQREGGNPMEKAFAVFLMLMAVWAAGLLLQPHIT